MPTFTLRQAQGNACTRQYSHTSDFGLAFYNARMYDSALGRFISPDTIIPENQGVQAWDRFSYVSNNPLRFTDPTGHRNCEEDGYNCPGDKIIKPTSTPTRTPTRPPTSTPTSTPSSTSTSTDTPMPTVPTPTGGPLETAIALLPKTTMGQSVYSAIVAKAVNVGYNSICQGGASGNTISVNPCASSVYDAGTLAHEYIHMVFGYTETLEEEYVAFLAGDVTRSELIQKGIGSPSDMRNSISDYTVDLYNPNRAQLQSDLINWFANYERSKWYQGRQPLIIPLTPTRVPTP